MGRERGSALFRMELVVELGGIMSKNTAASADDLLLLVSSLMDSLIR